MDSTSVSLMDRMRQPGPEAWERFVSLYTPLLRRWARRLGADGPDAADLVQDVFVLLVRKMPDFRYEPGLRFRGWLWTVTANKWRERRRKPVDRPAGDELACLAAPDRADEVDEADYRQFIAGRALRLMQADFKPATWQAFWESTVEGRPAAEVADRLGLSVDSVYAARSRILRRLRQELNGLLD